MADPDQTGFAFFLMKEVDLVPHLFRTEFSKLVAVLTKSFGLEHIELAEDIASDSFLLALETWPYKGTPANPSAWLYAVAKNKLTNLLKRQDNFTTKISKNLIGSPELTEINLDFSDHNIADSQLQMLFTICHPSIPLESQICLALRILCGFGLDEIADAFLSNREAIHKKLQRAKQKLQTQKFEICFLQEGEIDERINSVLHTIYLLFSEGYYSESNEEVIREELCVEAINLTSLLLDNRLTNTHASNALMSLMCFQSSRLRARKSQDGNLILYDDQDRKLWDTEFIEKGFYYLQKASRWEISSPYYIEASIAYWHTVDNNHSDKWSSILKLYDALTALNKSPIVSMNRIWAYAKVFGPEAAIVEAERLELKTNHFYFLLLAELHKGLNTKKAMDNYQTAFRICKTDREKQIIQKHMDDLQGLPTG